VPSARPGRPQPRALLPRAGRRGARRRPRLGRGRSLGAARDDRRGGRRTILAEIGAAFQATALSGALLPALAVAAAAGLVAFLSPCVLPVVPGCLGYVSGLAGPGALGA